MSFRTKRRMPKPTKPNPQRCAGCYQWTSEIAMIGARWVKGGKAATYIACPKCAERLEQDQNDPEINRNIQTYLQDRVPADQP